MNDKALNQMKSHSLQEAEASSCQTIMNTDFPQIFMRIQGIGDLYTGYES